MPGTNAGTGRPLFFRCSRCRKLDGSRRGQRWEPTGRVRRLAKSQEGTGGRRVAYLRYEYRCLDCGHTGWSRHIEVERRWLTMSGTARRVTANDLKERP
jgi:hypothetical protein